MRSKLKTVAAASALLAAPALYAHAAAGPQEGGIMEESGPVMVGGMMGMMAQMHRMMATCTEMMQAHMDEHGAPRPNEQWRAPEGGEAPELPIE